MVSWSAAVNVGDGERLWGLVNKRYWQSLARRALVYFAVSFGISYLVSSARSSNAGSLAATSAVTSGEHSSGLPFEVHSAVTNGIASGEIKARLNFPFTAVSAALSSPQAWCQFLTFHLNVKGCIYQDKAVGDKLFGDDSVRNKNGGGRVIVYSGRKEFQPLGKAFALEYEFVAAAPSAGVLNVTLSAARGPLNTKDYVIDVAVRELSSTTTELEILYRYHASRLARLSMETYLATAGSRKVGFTVTTRDVEGRPVYITGDRGVMERNTMRYYLAIQAYLEGATVPPAERIEWASTRWFDLTEQYALQLHEIERNDYLANKRREFLQQASQQAVLESTRR